MRVGLMAPPQLDHGDGWLPYLVTPDQLRSRLAATREVASRLGEYADAGAETVVFAPASPSEELDRVVDTFASHVLPRLRPTSKAGGG